MIKSILAFAAGVAMTSAAMAQAVPFKVIAALNGVEDGELAYLVNYDTGDKMDSVIVKDHAVVFTGKVDEPYMARILVNGARHGTLILEPGTVAINQDKRRGVGNMLNDECNTIKDNIADKYEKAAKADSENGDKQPYYDMLEYMRGIIADNIDNPIGYSVFLDYASIAGSDEMMDMVRKYPDLQNYRRVQNLMNAVIRKNATSEGHMFTDFAITHNGTTKKLSDYVGKGKYVLVDFWASWCGPCMREIETLKDINSKYAGDDFQILGVAVWDEPENTLKAMQRKQIPWECIINAQTIPTDLYGISGIPCIILFGPDGTILSRDLQGDELKAAVAEHMGR